jgi:hypothetical protein
VKDKKYIIGLTIIVLTFLISLNVYFAIYSIPVFIIGVIILWTSKKKIITKILFTIIPIIVWYPSTNAFWYLSGIIGKSNAQKLDFNFPDNFKGAAVVVHQIDCGQDIIKINGREQLNIPENGILLYKGKIEDGYINHQYYYIKKNGLKVKLPERADYMFWDDAKSKTSSSEVGVWIGGVGMETSTSGDSPNYSFLEMVVLSKDSLEKFYDFERRKRFDSLKYSMIKSCK